MPNKSILAAFANSPELVEAVKAIILEQFGLEKIDIKNTNEQLGAFVRARLEGAALVELAFREIEMLKTQEPQTEKINPAR